MRRVQSLSEMRGERKGSVQMVKMKNLIEAYSCRGAFMSTTRLSKTKQVQFSHAKLGSTVC